MLLRALRDFNLGKLTSDDTSIFLGLLNDLFPRTLELVPRAVDREFEAQCKASARELKYQADEMFSLKISQVRTSTSDCSVGAIMVCPSAVTMVHSSSYCVTVSKWCLFWAIEAGLDVVHLITGATLYTADRAFRSSDMNQY